MLLLLLLLLLFGASALWAAVPERGNQKMMLEARIVTEKANTDFKCEGF